MRTNRNLALLLALFIFSSIATTAQKKFCPTPPPSPFKHNGQIVTSFDAKGGGMRTTLEHPRPLAAARSALFLSATFVHADPRRPDRQLIELAVASVSPEARYRGRHELAFVCDGKPVPAASAARYQTRAAGAQGLTLEVVRVTLSKDDLVRLATARKVAGRVGADEFELTSNHIEALRELASLIGGARQGWRTE